MPLSDHANILISIDSVGIALAGFGIPLIPSATADFSELVRFYTGAAEGREDFPAGSPERLAIEAMFAQSNKPELVAVGRCTRKPTQKYEIGVSLIADDTDYQIRVQGPGITDTTVSATAGTPGTVEFVHSELVTALNAVVGKNYTAAFAPLVVADKTFTAAVTDIVTIATHGLLTGDGPFRLTSSGTLPAGLALATDYWITKIDANTFKFAASLGDAINGDAPIDITTTGTGTHTLSDTASTVSPTSKFTVTGNAAGNWFSLEVLDPNGLSTSNAVKYLSNAQIHADPGVADDLDDMLAENASWYALYTLYNSKAYVLGVAAWVETQPRIYVADTCDSATITQTTGLSDVGDTLKTQARSRTMWEYHPSPADMLGAALQGEVLPLAAGAETWAFKQLSGPREVRLSTTQRVNLRAKNGNTYERQTDDLVWTYEGTCADGEFLDTIRGLDALRDDALKSIAAALAANPKIPYTDGGAILLGQELEGVFKRGVTAQILADDPEPVVVIPKVRTQSTANRKARRFAGLKGSARLAGAIHFLDPVTISVTA